MTSASYTASEAKKLLLLVLQQHGDGIHPLSLELIALARRFAKEGGLATAGVFITGELTEKSRAELGRSGLGEIHIYENSRYRPFVAECHCAALLNCVATLKPEVLLVGATPEGRILAPMAAIPLNSGVTADCTELAIEQPGGLLLQTRPAFGGGVMARILTPEARPQIATIRSGVFGGGISGEIADAANTRVIMHELPVEEHRIRVEALENTGAEDIRASAILALGAGLRAKEDIEPFREFCERRSMELMCSRSLVERGWFPHSRQIGLSGQSVCPELLITMGISGSVQFMAGIRGVKRLVAINKEPAAPILRVADVPIVGDLYPIIEELSAAVS